MNCEIKLNKYKNEEERKQAKREAVQRYYRRNKEKIKEKNKVYYMKNKYNKKNNEQK